MTGIEEIGLEIRVERGDGSVRFGLAEGSVFLHREQSFVGWLDLATQEDEPPLFFVMRVDPETGRSMQGIRCLSYEEAGTALRARLLELARASEIVGRSAPLAERSS